MSQWLTPVQIAEIVRQECVNTENMSLKEKARIYGCSIKQLKKVLQDNRVKIDEYADIIAQSVKADLKRAGRLAVEVLKKGLRSHKKYECADKLLNYGIGRAGPDSVVTVNIPQMVIQGRNGQQVSQGAVLQGLAVEPDDGAEPRIGEVQGSISYEGREQANIIEGNGAGSYPDGAKTGHTGLNKTPINGIIEGVQARKNSYNGEIGQITPGNIKKNDTEQAGIQARAGTTGRQAGGCEQAPPITSDPENDGVWEAPVCNDPFPAEEMGLKDYQLKNRLSNYKPVDMGVMIGDGLDLGKFSLGAKKGVRRGMTPERARELAKRSAESRRAKKSEEKSQVSEVI